MHKLLLSLLAFLLLQSCQTTQKQTVSISTTDITHFWEAFDQITATKDSVLQYKLLDSLYFKKGSAGLAAIKQARNYTPQDYINAINQYPKFWNSVRQNTLTADHYKAEILAGIAQLKQLYPELKSRKIFFTIGAMRTGGTYLDSLVLIGSEMAFANKNTVATELPEALKAGREAYFKQNPIDDVVFLTLQEYVHTQQKPFVHNLLSYCLHEGVGDFVANKALNIAPKVPAIAYGKKHKAVREKFEKEMFYGHNIQEWLWSDAPNEFGVRDLGYYIGYQICENYYQKAANKNEALQTMIQLDYEDQQAVASFIQKANFFSAPLATLEKNYESRRPKVLGITPVGNSGKPIAKNTKQLTITFSEPMHQAYRNFDYGPLGETAVVKFESFVGWSKDGTSLTIAIQDLQPNKHYQLTIGSGFRNLNNVPLKPYLLDFTTTP